MNLSIKQKQTQGHREQPWGCQGGGEEAGGQSDWGFGMTRYKPLYTGQINSKVLLYCTENYIQYPVPKHNGKEL